MKKIIASIAVLVPTIVSAQPISDVNSLSFKLTNLGNNFLGLLIGLAVIVIVVNVVRFILKSDAPEERTAIGKHVLWSIVGLFVILSIWGLVAILTNTFRTERNAPTNQFPRVQYPSQVP